MISTLKSIVAATALAVVASSASAATVTDSVSLDLSVTDNFTRSADVLAGDSLEYTFTAATAMRVLDLISAAATGTSQGADLTAATLGLNGTLANFQVIEASPGSSDARSRFAGFDLASGDTFTFTFDNTGGANLIGTTLSLSIAAIPVPAAGLLLLTALGGMGAMSRRKKALA